MTCTESLSESGIAPDSGILAHAGSEAPMNNDGGCSVGGGRPTLPSVSGPTRTPTACPTRFGPVFMCATGAATAHLFLFSQANGGGVAAVMALCPCLSLPRVVQPCVASPTQIAEQSVSVAAAKEFQQRRRVWMVALD